MTNAEYAKFKPSWPLSDDKPVVGVSCRDALAYCGWLTARDSGATYRLPTEEEWEIAAGHMPKDADFNAKGEDFNAKGEDCCATALKSGITRRLLRMSIRVCLPSSGTGLSRKSRTVLRFSIASYRSSERPSLSAIVL